MTSKEEAHKKLTKFEESAQAYKGAALEMTWRRVKAHPFQFLIFGVVVAFIVLSVVRL